MFGMFGGNTPSYQGIAGAQARPNQGFFGFLAGLFGGNGAVVYKQPSPEQALPTCTKDEQELAPVKKAITVIVVLDSQALADAILQQLGDPASMTEA